MKSSKPSFLFLAMVMPLANLINREAADAIEYLLEYNKILKSKLEKDNKQIRFTPTERARLARKGTKCSRKILNRFSELLSPKTLFRWRDWYIAKKYTQKKPPQWSEVVETRECVRRLVCKFASENPMWGAGRIFGALKQLGIKRTKTTVYKIMLSNGFDPNPEGKNFRVNRLWLDFIKRHLNLMVGADFFTVEVFTLRGIIRYLVFFVIDCATKKVKIIHVSHTFDGDKMATLGRQMTDCFDGILKNKKYFFCDKDVLYTQKFRDILKNSGIKVKQVPNPICNPYAERFVKSIKR